MGWHASSRGTSALSTRIFGPEPTLRWRSMGEPTVPVAPVFRRCARTRVVLRFLASTLMRTIRQCL
jgi:hypothetical protein